MAEMTVAGVLARLAAWAEDGETYRDAPGRLERAASQLGYRDLVDCNDIGGLPAVRATIARAREGATDGQ